MKKIILTLLIPVCASVSFAQTGKKTVPAKKVTTVKTTTAVAAQPVAMKTTLDSASYAFGMGMAANFKRGGINSFNYAMLVQGLKDAFTEKKPLLTEEKAQACINNFLSDVNAQQSAQNKAKYAVTMTENQTFLENNKKQAGVQVTASGLQYLVITKGVGINPKATDTVTVHYAGTLIDGKEFDSSYKRNEPTTFPLNRVIPGWTEGLQLMQPGAKYKFFVPYQLGYGDSGAPDGGIPPFATLIFEIELLKINGK
ncbi:MAG: FKBP-type peptidyl-prolyl cis-trans isomerase [Bacteroidota bacterium]